MHTTTKPKNEYVWRGICGAVGRNSVSNNAPADDWFPKDCILTRGQLISGGSIARRHEVHLKAVGYDVVVLDPSQYVDLDDMPPPAAPALPLHVGIA